MIDFAGDPSSQPGARSIATTGYDKILADFEAAIGLLQDAGLRIPSGSRFLHYGKLLRAFVEAAQRRSPPAVWDGQALFRGLLEIDELTLIVTELSRRLERDQWKPKLQEMVDGHIHPSRDRNAKARNSQFEFLLAAYASSAGYGIDLLEPDVNVHDEQGRLALAAKRPRSEAMVFQNIKGACQQVEKYSRDGFTAIDLSVVANPRGRAVPYQKPEDALLGLENALDTWVATSRHEILRFVRGKHAAALVVRMTAVAVNPGAPQVGTLTRIVGIPFRADGDPVVQRVRRIVARISETMAVRDSA